MPDNAQPRRNIGALASAGLLEASGLSVDYQAKSGPIRAVNDVSFQIGHGEFFTLLGPSGCGKTTTLRAVAGFETPFSGSIRLGDDMVFSDRDRVHVPVHRRDIAMVFQSYAIWPHMSVAQNVRFPLESSGVPAADARARVSSALELVGLGAHHDRPATQLSGGQQQRVALARAIVRDAKLLLLDEPLSNLDAQLREQMRVELSGLQKRLGTTTLYVTHDQEEALSLSDRIALMRDGRIVESGTPQDLYYRPTRLFTAQFIGQTVLLPCKVLRRSHGTADVQTSIGTLACAIAAHEGPVDATLMIRPEHFSIVPSADGSANCVDGIIRSLSFLGRIVEYRVEVGQAVLKLQTLSTQMHAVGSPVGIHVLPDRCVLIDETEAMDGKP